MNQETKHPFDYSGASLWTKDPVLIQINMGKINGTKRRAQIKKTEIQGHHPYQAKKNKK